MRGTRKRRTRRSRHTLRNQKRCPKKPAILRSTKSIHPGTNFFKHINSTWYEHAQIKPYTSAVSATSEAQDIINNQLLVIINEARAKAVAGTSASKDMIAIGRFAESALRKKYQKNTFRSVKDLIQQIHCIRDRKDVATILGALCVRGIPTILNVYTGPEDKNSKHWRMHIVPGSLGLPSTEYYEGKGPGGMNTLIGYEGLMKNVGEYFELEELEQVVQLEATLTKYIYGGWIYDAPISTGLSLQRRYNNIPWGSFFDAIKCPSWKTEKFVIEMPAFLRHLNKMFKDENLDNWRRLFWASVIRFFMPVMAAPLDTYYFDFFKRRLRGDTAKPSDEIVMLEFAKKYLIIPLGMEYVKRHVPADYKKELTGFIRELFDAAKDRISDTDWMDISTRRAAKAKVDGITLGALYPDREFNFTTPDLVSDDFAENLMRLGMAVSVWQMKDVRQKLTYQVWTNMIYNVNAHYYSTGNRLIIPAGIASWPFYCRSAALGWNYGGLGSTIGHELTHAFDVNGKEFDAEGELVDWWTVKDDRAYNKRTRALVELFGRSKYVGHSVNGNLTLSENIADLGGLAIALGALEAELKRLGVNVDERLDALRNFFTGYAVCWREKERKKKGLQGLLTDVHAPAELRVNLIVPHFQEWYDAFNIGAGDKMYIPPEKRTRIF